tara:strand:- start:1460 stop:1876 length:417 start_codon:yes stop_codon:yes gene_type:complete
MSDTEIPNHLMGDVSLNDIRDAIIKSATIDSHQEMISLTDMAHIIWDLHILKIETNKTTAINNSIIKTTTILNELDMKDMKEDHRNQYESIKNIYNSVMYYTILASIKTHGDAALWENGKKDFGPLIKKYWDLFCEEC